ncbi:SlyX family protein [Paracoccus sp. CPCC 101403]|uniref:SlyX family protein n=2 Tax=Paracoccus broussonetiae TaxID=3075834 RepID=A0ABU3EC22_9RHOB|nr:SlyX family protein [Paracoccus sp. CPCC 101403]MDT1061759.1 SlyX family protein [Paracoccus sp. CPCC 101403]
MDKQALERTERLEEAVAHLTRITDDLSGIVARQEGEIARLLRRLDLLMEREAEREAEGGTIPLADQRPPHW